jgi:hypothetical protein
VTRLSSAFPALIRVIHRKPRLQAKGIEKEPVCLRNITFSGRAVTINILELWRNPPARPPPVSELPGIVDGPLQEQEKAPLRAEDFDVLLSTLPQLHPSPVAAPAFCMRFGYVVLCGVIWDILVVVPLGFADIF